MSLGGRKLIDKCKTRLGSWLKLPCPPYGNTRYWEGVYKSLGPADAHEWGSISLNESLLEYEYKRLDALSPFKEAPSSAQVMTSTFSEAIGVDPNDSTNTPIILLGCGNSKLGEEMAQHGWRGPLLQVDVVSRVLDTMSERCIALVEQGVMDFCQDDATQLSAFDNEQVNAIVDKGLVDALFCADEHKQVKGVVYSAHRVLKVGGMLVFFSLSQPQFLMPHIIPTRESQEMWKEIQVRQLNQILMYRLEKNDGSSMSTKRKGLTRQSMMQRKKHKSKKR